MLARFLLHRNRQLEMDSFLDSGHLQTLSDLGKSHLSSLDGVKKKKEKKEEMVCSISVN